MWLHEIHFGCGNGDCHPPGWPRSFQARCGLIFWRLRFCAPIWPGRNGPRRGDRRGLEGSSATRCGACAPVARVSTPRPTAAGAAPEIFLLRCRGLPVAPAPRAPRYPRLPASARRIWRVCRRSARITPKRSVGCCLSLQNRWALMASAASPWSSGCGSFKLNHLAEAHCGP